MKKIFLSLAVIGVVGITAAGATRAYFSDAETSTGNTFTAGTLNLKVGSVDGGNVNFTFGGTTPIKPTDSGTLSYTLNNAGTLDGILAVSNASTTNNALAQHLNVTIKLDGGTALWTGTLDQIATGLALVSKTIPTGGSSVLTMDWEWPSSSTDNAAQGQTATLDMSFTLTQQTN